MDTVFLCKIIVLAPKSPVDARQNTLKDMGSVGAQYSLCEKCHALFSEADTATTHTKTCEGDIALAVCEFVACTKEIYMKFVRPQMSKPRRKVLKRNAPESTGSDEKAAMSSKQDSAGSVVEHIPPTATPRRYGLRKGASEALHNKISSMQRQLGVRGKVVDRTQTSSATPLTDSSKSANKSKNGDSKSANQSKLNGSKSLSETTTKDIPETNIENNKNLQDPKSAKDTGTRKETETPQNEDTIADSNSIEANVSEVTATKECTVQKGSPKQSRKSMRQKNLSLGTQSLDTEQNKTESQSLINENTTDSTKNTENTQDNENSQETENAKDNTTSIEHAYSNTNSTNQKSNSTENGNADCNKNTQSGTEEVNSEEEVSEVRTSKRLKLKKKDSPLMVKEVKECPEPDAEGVYHCTLCSYTTVKQGMFRRHMGAHNDGEMYTCEFCSATFAYQRLYKQHLGIHKGFRCDVCGKVFTRRHDRTRHIESTHIGTKKYVCQICGYECRHHHMLTDHQRKHTNERYRCPHGPCQFETVYRRALMHHMSTVHNDQKHLMCDTCGYKTNDSFALSKHRKVHSNKIYACGLCDYRAHSLHYVTLHMTSHNQEKLYKCDQCDYASARRTGIRSHMMKHIGVKPWQCPNCEYSSTTKAKTQRHISMRHKGVGQPQRRNITIKFDLNAYKVNTSGVEVEGEGNNEVNGEAGGGGVVQEEGGAQLPPGYKYMVIEMVEDTDGAALSSNLVGQEVVVYENSTEDSNSNKTEANVEVRDSNNEAVEKAMEEEDIEEETPLCLYKCALCDMTSSALEVIQEHMATDHPDLIAAQLVEQAAASQSMQNEAVTQSLQDDAAMHSIQNDTSMDSLQNNVTKHSMQNDVVTHSIQSNAASQSMQNDKENIQVECVHINALEEEDVQEEPTMEGVDSQEVTCIYEAGTEDGDEVAQVIEVVQPLAYPGQTVTMQDDAVSTAVESILHLQHIPVNIEGT